ncbi:MAG: glycosyltransferase [Lachnospiraceae bacterium]|nr:glycosyltransferase [Lachnospiraceae bacterium]
MHDKIKVSIIVAVYKVENYIDECIQSLVSQSYKNIEILIINDGSPDRCDEICKQWEDKDSRIRYIYTKNKGVSRARNIGIDHSSGSWICFVDGDDYLCENAIQNLVYGINNETDIVIGDYFVKQGNLQYEEYFYSKAVTINNERKMDIIRDAMLGIRREKIGPGVPWGRLYRKSLIDQYSIRFPVGLKRMEDVVFNLYVFNKMRNICYLHQIVYYYRIRSDSAVRDYDWNYVESILRFINEIDIFAKDNNFFNDEWIQIYQNKKIQLFSECVRSAYCRKECTVSLRERINSMKKIEKQIMNFSYNEIKVYFSKKQLLVLFLLKHKMYFLLWLILYLKQKKCEFVV